MGTRHWADIVFAADEPQRAVLTRAVRAGRLRRIGPGIYTGNVRDPVEQVVLRNWATIASHELPGAIFADRSARTHRPEDGRLFVVHSRRRPLSLPGFEIIPRPGPGILPGDTPLPDGLVLPSVARALLDNLGARPDRRMPLEQVERWIADIVQGQGENILNRVRDQARELAQQTGKQRAFERLDRIIAAALTTGSADVLVSQGLQARAAGHAYDVRRLDLFKGLTEYLAGIAPQPLPALPEDEARRRLLPFYEAYFSNYIEGTEFTLDEAARIVLEGQMPAERPADAHDIMGTYALTAHDREMARVPTGPGSFLALLRERHGRILAGRPEQRPGQWKRRDNRAGSTIFVAPAMVEPTLVAGWESGRSIIDPFARAVFTMFVVSEVHPFADGNGRVARVMMNAELVHAGQIRIIIPTVFRNNYLTALKGASHNSTFDSLVAVLRFAQQFTARVDFSSRSSAEPDLRRTNALRDPNEADALGIRLQLP